MSDTPKPLGGPFANTTELLIHKQKELETELVAAHALIKQLEASLDKACLAGFNEGWRKAKEVA